jgi:hypothetical protein
MKKLLLIPALLLAGCATVVPPHDSEVLTGKMNEMLKGYDGQIVFLSYPSVGKARDTVFMNQRATIGRPTQAGMNLARMLTDSLGKKTCLTITGASSARTEYIVTEAFSMIASDVKFPQLTILFMGEVKYEKKLRSVVEGRGSTFMFSKYSPPVKSE